MSTIRKFETKNFTVKVEALPESDLDMRDYDKELRNDIERDLESGKLQVFCVRATCQTKFGTVLASDYLGQCIYESPAAFMDHRGIKQSGCGSYFSDMVSNVCEQGRIAFHNLQKSISAIRVRA